MNRKQRAGLRAVMDSRWFWFLLGGLWSVVIGWGVVEAVVRGMGG